MLNDYCQTILKRELQKSDYEGLSADGAWSWLMEPVPQSPLPVPTGLKITPAVLAGLVGADKAEACAAALKVAYPLTADHLMQTGIDPIKQESSAFIGRLVTKGVLTKADADAIAGAAVPLQPRPPLPRRFDGRFFPSLWPHVAPDGTEGGPEDKAISGFPNTISRADFDAAWTAAGRN